MSDAWQDISTAPKDGRPVRILDPVSPWSARITLPARWAGLYWRKLHRRGFVNMRAYPTFWQPLEPPLTSQSSVPSPDRE